MCGLLIRTITKRITMKLINIVWPGVIALISITGCQKKINNDPDVLKPDLALSLKEAAPFPLGVGVDYDPFMANGNYTNIIKAQFDNVTAGYVMKHGAIVQGNGTYNF